MADSLVSLNVRTAARSASGPSTAVASATRAAGFDNDVQRRADRRHHRVRGRRAQQRGRRALVADQRLDQQRVPATRGRPGRAPGRWDTRAAARAASSVASNRVSGFRWTTAVRGSRRRRATPSAARRGRVGARRGQHQQRHVLVVEPEHEVAQQVDGGDVGPVDVVDEDDRRRGAGVLEHEAGEREQRAGALALDHLGGVGGRAVRARRSHPLEHRMRVRPPRAGERRRWRRTTSRGAAGTGGRGGRSSGLAAPTPAGDGRGRAPRAPGGSCRCPTRPRR